MPRAKKVLSNNYFLVNFINAFEAIILYYLILIPANVPFFEVPRDLIIDTNPVTRDITPVLIKILVSILKISPTPTM